ncbi:MAG: EF-hand domain-containing protein, partial [Deltaproteobacteria bacterium]|nr:EF-hand domain-containing protein [Deltaproteobacteria bacterium]
MISGISGISGNYMNPVQMTAMHGKMGNPFEKIDSNGDGSIKKTELSSFAGEISEMTGRSVDVDQMISKFDADNDGLISQEKFKAGRPEGAPPDMMGMMGGMQGGGMQPPLDMPNRSEAESSSSIDLLDTNGDGVVDPEEAKSGSNYLIQKYLSQMFNTLSQDS